MSWVQIQGFVCFLINPDGSAHCAGDTFTSFSLITVHTWFPVAHMDCEGSQGSEQQVNAFLMERGEEKEPALETGLTIEVLSSPCAAVGLRVNPAPTWEDFPCEHHSPPVEKECEHKQLGATQCGQGMGTLFICTADLQEGSWLLLQREESSLEVGDW